MPREKKHTAEQVVNLVRQFKVSIANGKTTGLACKEASTTEPMYYRWRREWSMEVAGGPCTAVEGAGV